MALGLTDLINNIQGSIQGLTGNESFKAIPRYFKGYTDFRGIQSQVNPSNWNVLTFPYTFAVVSLKDPTKSPFGDFPLPLAPSNINQKEGPAINIRATQGGTTTNHNGNRYKMLQLQGTTGIAPFRGAGGVNAKTGEAIFQPKELKYKSGYEVFLHFRNWLRTYYEFKHKQGKSASDLRLIFKNYKDGEFLIIELMPDGFEMDRQAAKSFLYDYKIEFKVISHFKFDSPKSEILAIESVISDALDKINLARGIFLRTQGILRQIESTYENVVLNPLRQLTLAVKALQGIGVVAADLSKQAVNNTISAAKALAIAIGINNLQQQNLITGTLDSRIAGIKLPKDLSSSRNIQAQGSGNFISSFGEGLMALDISVFPPESLSALSLEQTTASSLPRSFYVNAIQDLERVKQNAEDFFNLGSTQYDSIFNRTTTLKAVSSKIVTNDEYDLLNAFNQSITAIYMILSTTDLFKVTFDDKVQDMVSRFSGNIQLFANQAVEQIKLTQGMTLEKLAQIHLADSQRWGEIVEVNSLKAPYIYEGDKTQQPEATLMPGDNILIPISPQNGFSQVPSGAPNKLTQNMSELERSLGCDFKLTSDMDLALTSSGDIDLIAGASNMGQAVLIKLGYEPGEVMRYPSLGAGIIPGRKFPAIEDLKDGIVNTLMQDSRINSIENLALRQESSALFVTFDLLIRQVDIPVPVKLRVG